MHPRVAPLPETPARPHTRTGRRTLVRRTLQTALSVAVALVLVAVAAPPANATPPNIPSYSTAVSRLAALTVAAESHQSTYDRDLFPHWITITGSCNTREQVLKRDGTGVVVNSSCYPTAGSWYSPYDGATWTDPADIDIDHMVPLAEAWRSGAWAWTTAQRQTYANDLGGPELWAVTDNVNQAKGDQDPAHWKPSRTSFWCTYVRAWIQVKWYYNLTVDSTEKSALSTMLTYC
ncbi:MAG: HNH endonuclease [Hamadaea sp.]|nr:HNH endonuclease [Hamadaea sp.]